MASTVGVGEISTMVGSRELWFGAHERFGIGRMSISERKIEYVYFVIRFALTTALICSGTLASAQAGPPSESRVATIVFSGADNGDRTFPHRTILGEVKDADGKPVDGAMVYLRDVNNASLRVQLADEKGAYHFGPLSLSHDFEIWAEFKDRTTPKKPVSSFITTNQITMPLRFVTVPATQDVESSH
jgi:hypothetical protein